MALKSVYVDGLTFKLKFHVDSSAFLNLATVLATFSDDDWANFFNHPVTLKVIKRSDLHSALFS